MRTFYKFFLGTWAILSAISLFLNFDKIIVLIGKGFVYLSTTVDGRTFLIWSGVFLVTCVLVFIGRSLLIPKDY